MLAIAGGHRAERDHEPGTSVEEQTGAAGAPGDSPGPVDGADIERRAFARTKAEVKLAGSLGESTWARMAHAEQILRTRCDQTA